MNSSEKLCLKRNDFPDNIKSAFGELRHDKDFTDVTLVCDDGEQFEAHKIILTSSSPFFGELLKKNKHPHPLICMRRVKSCDLKAILDFLYFGEANVFQDDLHSFLAIAEDLRLLGLTGFTEPEGFVSVASPDAKVKIKTKDSDPKVKILTKQERTISPESFKPFHGVQDFDIKLSNSICTNLESDEEVNVFSSRSVAPSVNSEVQELDNQINFLMDISDNMVTAGRQTLRAKICKACGKEGHPTDIKRHIEANHIKGLTHACDVCGKNSRSRHGLRQHKRTEHKTYASEITPMYPCS